MIDPDERLAGRVARLVAAMPADSAPALAPLRRARLRPMFRGVAAIVAIVLVVAVIGIGLLTTGRLSIGGPSGPVVTTKDGQFRGLGIDFDYPREWRVYRTFSAGSFFSTLAVMGNQNLDGCRTLLLGPLDVNCASRTTLKPGTLRLVVGAGGMPGYSILDHEPAGGFPIHVDGLPATFSQSGPNSADGSDLNLNWTFAHPGSVDNFYSFHASLRGPGIEKMRAQLDALVGSVHYSTPPQRLPTGAAAEPLLERATAGGVNFMDRDARDIQNSDMYACLPREPNSSRTTIIMSGPNGPLTSPLSVTCSTRAQPTELQLWRLTLEIAWDAGPAFKAGSLITTVWVSPDGTPGATETTLASDFPYSQSPASPSPVAGRVNLTLGLPAVVVDPGATTYFSPDFSGHSLNSLSVGTRLFVVSGPQTVGETDWYLVQWPPMRSYVPALGWLPSKVHGRPQAQTVAPDCPSAPTQTQLVAMAWGERLLCYASNELTLSPVIVGRDERPQLHIDGTPAWLADDSSLRLYDQDGPLGVGGSIPVYVDPASGFSLPIGERLQVIGHFDDPAAAGCHRSFTGSEASNLVPETPDVQVLRCRENFVISAFRIL
jgi:hypothetical protein